jgi:hypothetical protein
VVDVQNTIKRAFISYITLIMLALPAGICSHQHRIPAFFDPGPEIDPMALQFMPLEVGPTLADVLDTGMVPKENEPPFHAHIMQAAKTYDVDAALIRAIILAESSFNPRAVSNRGAQGLMQLMPATARSLGVEDSFDPAVNIDAGVSYFRKMLNRFDGDIRLALAAYNAGSRHVRNYGGVPPFGATRQYIHKVLEYQKQYQNEMTDGLGEDSSV